jgi:2-oxo-4-hydroxy-4-carboxy--5-ureidoimidazoline (OHCU) decarboxylase
MEELLNKYAEKFGENFPIFFVRNKDEKEITSIIQKCLNDNQPFKVDDDGESDY